MRQHGSHDVPVYGKGQLSVSSLIRAAYAIAITPAFPAIGTHRARRPPINVRMAAPLLGRTGVQAVQNVASEIVVMTPLIATGKIARTV